jgi:acetyl-CoA carboxylase biotin carboxyl carrier protein
MGNEKQSVDPALVRELAAILREADLGEIEVEHGDLKIRISKPATPAAPAYYQPAPAPAQAAPMSAAPAPQTGPSDGPPALAADEAIITSPMVGTFYRAPSPEASPFVNKGDNIGEKTVICIIEAMKVMNEIKADISGQIIEVLVGEAEAVEFGTPLFKVRRG